MAAPSKGRRASKCRFQLSLTRFSSPCCRMFEAPLLEGFGSGLSESIFTMSKGESQVWARALHSSLTLRIKAANNFKVVVRVRPGNDREGLPFSSACHKHLTFSVGSDDCVRVDTQAALTITRPENAEGEDVSKSFYHRLHHHHQR